MLWHARGLPASPLTYVVLVVSRQKGIGLVFETEPFKNHTDMNGTFDSKVVFGGHQSLIQCHLDCVRIILVQYDFFRTNYCGDNPMPSPDLLDGTFPKMLDFDPIYDLRPEGLPIFRSFGSLFVNPGRGLADLSEECAGEDDDVVGDKGAWSI
jgi:hypothetical protein